MKFIRRIALDVETTGLDPAIGHRIIEIGCVIVSAGLVGATFPTDFQCYVNPDYDIDPESQAIHKLDRAFLAHQPRFAEVADAFINYITGAEVLIHNAPFDVSFLDAELKRIGREPLASYCTIVDTLLMARDLYPDQRCGLSPLCERLGIDISARATRHGALIDAGLVAKAYWAMKREEIARGGQNSIPQPPLEFV